MRTLTFGKSLASLILGVCCAMGAAHAEFPHDKPLTVISPYAAGGANDFLTRLMAKELGKTLGIKTVADNKAGANGIVGASFVVNAPADAYTLLMGNSATHGTNPTLYPDTPYDAIKDFEPVGMVGAVPIVLAIHSGLGINSVKELIEYGKKNPGKLSFSSSGVGGTGHLAGETFKRKTGLDIVHVPYKGDAPAVTDAMGGQVSMAFVGVSSAVQQMASGKIKVLAVAHPNRLSSMPDVPTMKETGVDGVEFSQWYALVTRAGADPQRIRLLNDAVRKIVADEEVKKSVATLGAETIDMTPDQLREFIRNEINRFGSIIRELKLVKGS
mgnify:CR=1 FL=1|jgi:Uncharacterized protein conserved in bacteria